MSTALDQLLPGQRAVLAPIGSAFSVTLGKMLDAGKAVEDSHTTLPYIRAANIQDEGLRLTDVNEMPFTAAEARRLDLREGDLLVVEGGAVGTCVVLDHDMPGWSFQKTVNRVRATSDWSTRYLAYVLRSYRGAGIIDLICDGSTISHLTAEKLRALRVPAVQPETQRAIADFLDHETAQIDVLVARQNDFIALLQERRSSRTADILADLGAPDTQLRRVAQIQTGVTLSGDGDPSLPLWPYLRVANVQMGRVDLSEIKTLHLSHRDASSSTLRTGDVLMT